MLVAQAKVGRPGWSVCVVGVADFVVSDVRFGAVGPASRGGLAVLEHSLCEEALQKEASLVNQTGKRKKETKRGRSDNQIGKRQKKKRPI